MMIIAMMFMVVLTYQTYASGLGLGLGWLRFRLSSKTFGYSLQPQQARPRPKVALRFHVPKQYILWPQVKRLVSAVGMAEGLSTARQLHAGKQCSQPCLLR